MADKKKKGVLDYGSLYRNANEWLSIAQTTGNPQLTITNSRIDYSTAIANHLLLKQVKKGSYDNFVMSPVSIDIVLTMAAAGSRGPTLERMLVFLGAEDMDGIKSSAKAMLAAAAGGDEGGAGGGPVLCMVNGVWVDKRFPLVESYRKEILRGIYGCDAETVDFLHQAKEVEKKINSWAEDASKGLIKNLVQPGSISPETAIILANGLYFKGFWNDKFDASLTEERDFFLLSSDAISVPFMISYDKRYHYGSFDGFKVLKIPYRFQGPKLGRKFSIFSMYFFLPHKKVGLQNLLKKLCSDSGSSEQDNYFNLSAERLDQVWIPKFEVSYGFDVSKTMDEMGMMFPSLGNPEDLTEMMKFPKGVPLPLFCSRMIQKAAIKVDEEGTEAAAVTTMSVQMCAYPAPKEPKPSFIADHPFMFMIREEVSRLIFFQGAVLNPSL